MKKRKRKYIKKLMKRLGYDLNNIISKSFEVEEFPNTEGIVTLFNYKNKKYITNPDSFCKGE